MCNCCSCKNTKEPIQFKVGLSDSPTNGTSVYSNCTIKYDKYTVEKNGYGYLLENIDYERLPNGGFKLLNSAIFDTGEVYTLKFYN